MESEAPNFGSYKVLHKVSCSVRTFPEAAKVLSAECFSYGGNLVLFPKVTKGEDGRMNVEATAVLFDHPENLRTSGQRYLMGFAQ
jgi:hypothetical protein